MKSRMQKLWDKTVPAGGPSPRPDPDAVLRRVNAALDGKPRIRLRRPLKCVLALSAVPLLSVEGRHAELLWSAGDAYEKKSPVA